MKESVSFSLRAQHKASTRRRISAWMKWKETFANIEIITPKQKEIENSPYKDTRTHISQKQGVVRKMRYVITLLLRRAQGYRAAFVRYGSLSVPSEGRARHSREGDRNELERVEAQSRNSRRRNTKAHRHNGQAQRRNSRRRTTKAHRHNGLHTREVETTRSAHQIHKFRAHRYNIRPVFCAPPAGNHGRM